MHVIKDGSGDIYCRTIHNSQAMETTQMPYTWGMDQKYVIYTLCVCISNGVLFSHKEEWNHMVWRWMDASGGHHVKLSKPASEKQRAHVFSHTRKIDSKHKHTQK
jgi:hypothetical protein